MHLEPGEVFQIKYGRGHTVNVKSLSMREKRQIVAGVKAVQAGAEADVAYETLINLVGVCLSEPNQDFCESLNEQQAMDIVQATLSGAMLTEGDEKKSESQH